MYCRQIRDTITEFEIEMHKDRDLKDVYILLFPQMSYFENVLCSGCIFCELRLTRIVQNTLVQFKCVFAQY